MGRYARVGHCLFLAALKVLGADFTVVDVQKVPVAGDPASAVVRVSVGPQVTEISCDVLVAGGGMGGVGAALAVKRHGLAPCITEETDWIGGQATAGGVSALDENRFIEISGGSRSYYAFRNEIRARSGGEPNPGRCYVSNLCFEPKVAVAVLDDMTQGIRILRRTVVLSLEKAGSNFESALVWNFDTRQATRVRFRYVLDATEMGDLLPMAGVPYVVGSEAKAVSGEPHASEKPNPACVQSFTYPFAVERLNAGTPIPKPTDYDSILKRQDFTLKVNYPKEYGWRGTFEYKMYGEDPPIPNNMSPGPFFNWRRIRFEAPQIGLMNWPRQDYAAESVLDRSPLETAQILQRAKRTSLAFLYWIQKDLGHSELQMKADVMGTPDGFSKYPYIRESRRMSAQKVVVEQDIVDEYQKGPRARWFDDAIGTGFYMVDIHPCGANERGRMMMPKPFQVPMGSLLPKTPMNFLPAGKNIGVTHLTNGAFRLHPIEWMVGEAAGTIASLALKGVRAVPEVQADLALAGVPLVWFDDLRTDHPAFGAIQLAAIRGWYPLGTADLHASPDAPLSRGEAAVALAAFFGEKTNNREDAIRRVIERGWMASDHRNWFHADLPFYWTDLRQDKLPRHLNGGTFGPVTRAAWALQVTKHE